MSNSKGLLVPKTTSYESNGQEEVGTTSVPIQRKQRAITSCPALDRRAFTAKETAGMLSISLKTLSRWEDRGLLVPLKVSRKKLYTREAIDRFLEAVK